MHKTGPAQRLKYTTEKNVTFQMNDVAIGAFSSIFMFHLFWIQGR